MTLSTEQMIEHLVLNVPNMAKISYRMYFGTPATLERMSIEGLQRHARLYLTNPVTNVECIYDDALGNGELITSLPSSPGEQILNGGD